jgi:hypothetical protein
MPDDEPNERATNASMNCVHRYNRTRLKFLTYKAPLEVLTDRAGHNTFAGMTLLGHGPSH